MRTTRALTALLALFSTTLAGADVLTSNLSVPVGAGTAFGVGATTIYKAFGFTTVGATQVASATVTLTINDVNSMPVLSIWSDGGGLPGAELVVLDTPLLVIGQNDVTFQAPGGSFPLAAGTSYWLHLRSDPLTAPYFTWEGTSPATLPTGTATSLGYIWNDNSSSYWNRLQIDCTGGGVGTSYCVSTVNSTGAASTISGSGSGSISANDLILSADNLPQQPGIFIAGPSSTQIPFFNGFLCVSPTGLQRFTTVSTPVGGTVSEVVDLSSSVPGGMNVAAGAPYFYQRWNRDPAGGGGSANFSDGLEVQYLP